MSNRAHFLATLARGLEGNAGDAADLALGIDHRVEADALRLAVDRARFNAAWLAEVDVARQFAHDQDIQPSDHFGLERRGIGEFGIEHGRAQVGEQAEILANAEEAALGTLLARIVVPLRAAHGTEQHGIGRARQLLGSFGIRIARGIDGATAKQRFFHFEFQTERIQNAHRLGSNLRTDAVTGQNTNFHDGILWLITHYLAVFWMASPPFSMSLPIPCTVLHPARKAAAAIKHSSFFMIVSKREIIAQA